MRHFPKKKNFRKFQVFFQKNVLRFLSLRYSADFRRSRLVFSTANLHHKRRSISERLGEKKENVFSLIERAPFSYLKSKFKKVLRSQAH